MHEKCGTREASPDNRNIRIVDVRIIEVRLYSRLRNKRAQCLFLLFSADDGDEVYKCKTDDEQFKRSEVY